MKDRNRSMINIEPAVFEEMRELSEITGIPISTYGKMLIQSGLPIIRTMRKAIVERDDFIDNRLDALSEMIEGLTGEAQEIHYQKWDKHQKETVEINGEIYENLPEHQHELENLSK